MDEFIKFNNQTSGRDKLFRLIQYSSKLIHYSMDKKGSSVENLKKVKQIDQTLSLMRRILRFGRFFESLPSAAQCMSLSNPIVRLTSVLSRISNFFFMFIDHVVCLDKIGLLPQKLINIEKWDRVSTKFWLYSILLALTRDFYEIMKIYKEEFQSKYIRKNINTANRLSSTTTSTDEYESNSETKGHRKNRSSGNQIVVKYIENAQLISKCIKEHSDVSIDFLKNLCDVFLPLNSLGFIEINSGIVGLLGVVSTVLSIGPQVNPMLKMVPST